MTNRTASSLLDPPTSLEGIEPKFSVVGDILLESGQILPNVQVAYETYGKLDKSAHNAVLIAHGYGGNQHAAGRYARGMSSACANDETLGWWNTLIGPGKAIDTNPLFVVSSNMLGSCYGTTGPASINPKTGKPYGPDFPVITVTDMINVQRALLSHLGIDRLLAVVGYSFGGYHAFQWAVTYPDLVDGIVVAASTPRGNRNPQIVHDLISRLSGDPNWHDGWYYDRGGIKETLRNLRIELLRFYSVDQTLESATSEACDTALRDMATSWADAFDGNSLVVLRRAAEFRDSEKDFYKIKAKVLFVLCRSDKLFPSTMANDVLAKLNAHDINAQYVELDSDKGHVGVLYDAAKWESTLRSFMLQLQSPLFLRSVD